VRPSSRIVEDTGVVVLETTRLHLVKSRFKWSLS